MNINNQNIKKDFELKDFSNLNYLQIVGSNIKNIPTSIGQCKKLKEVVIHSNQIDFLPGELFQLKQLSVLYFSHNKINSISTKIFSLPQIKEIHFSNNPYLNAPNFKMVNDLIKDADIDDETPFFELIKSLTKPDSNPNYNYFTLKIPKTLQTPMLQYIEFFKDYVEGTKGKNIIFEVKRDDEGLILITNGNTGIELPELGEYFQEYVGLVQQDLDNWIPKFETPKTAMEADILRAKVERQVRSLRSDLDIARLENKYLSNEVADKAAQINFLQSLTQDLQQDIRTLINGNTAKPLNVNQLLFDIQDQAVKMLERKYSHQLEDLHNDVMTDFLRQKGYYVTDQTRSGRSKLQVGEIDIMIRKKDGTPFSIIEAFRLKSCGDDNKIVAQHLDKLLHDYDTAGHQSNFVIVYAEAKNFEPLWENYKTYVSKLNGKPDFRANYPLITFEEKEEYSNKSSIKIGVGSHRREGAVVDIYHVFINMFG